VALSTSNSAWMDARRFSVRDIVVSY